MVERWGVVAFDYSLDQRFLREQGRLFGKPTERAAIDPNNARVLAAHAACAAHEMPLDPEAGGEDARTYFGSALPEACEGLIRARRFAVAIPARPRRRRATSMDRLERRLGIEAGPHGA